MLSEICANIFLLVIPLFYFFPNSRNYNYLVIFSLYARVPSHLIILLVLLVSTTIFQCPASSMDSEPVGFQYRGLFQMRPDQRFTQPKHYMYILDSAKLSS